MKKVFANTWNYLTPKEKTKFSLFIVLDLVTNLLDIAFLAILLWIIQFYIDPAHQLRFNFIPGWILIKDSVILIGLYFILFAIKNIAAIYISKAQYRFNSTVAVRISGNNLRKFQASDFNEFNQVDSSVHIRNIHFQPLEYCQYMLTGMQQLVTNLALVIFVITAILIYNALLFLVLLTVLLPPVAAVFYYIKTKLSLTKEQVRINSERSFQHLMDALKGFVESNIYNANHFFLQRFINYRKKYSDFLFTSISLQAMPSRLIETSAVLGLLLLIFVAGELSVQGSILMTIGAFMAAAYKIIPGMVKLINISGQMRTYGFMIENEKVLATKGTLLSTGSIHSIRLNELSFAYGANEVIHDVEFEVEKGIFAGLAGRSGVGKTTIFNLLLGFYPAKKGRILVNGISRSPEQLRSFWSSVAYVKQQNFLINDTILRNICFENEVSDPVRLEMAIKLSGLTEMIDAFPEGLEKIIVENGRNISGGQQQRIAIARALYKNADLILLDEPFSELDENSEYALLQHFRKLAEQGRIVFMITHNKTALEHCHTIISLDEAEAKNIDYSYARLSSQ